VICPLCVLQKCWKVNIAIASPVKIFLLALGGLSCLLYVGSWYSLAIKKAPTYNIPHQEPPTIFHATKSSQQCGKTFTTTWQHFCLFHSTGKHGLNLYSYLRSPTPKCRRSGLGLSKSVWKHRRLYSRYVHQCIKRSECHLDDDIWWMS
jgi:hypothetical protein